MQRFKYLLQTGLSLNSASTSSSPSLVSPKNLLIALLLSALLASPPIPLQAGTGAAQKSEYSPGCSVEIPSPEEVVLAAVEDVVNNGIIQGSKEYSRDSYVEKASAADSSSLFPQWKEGGRVFYKVRNKVLAPANFKESQDEGTLAVRYVVQSKDQGRTILRIDAVFVEDFRRATHISNGSVEGAECKDVQDHVDAIELKKKQADESEKHRQEELAKRALEKKREQEESAALAANPPSGTDLEQRVLALRRQVERVVKAPGAQLRSAPFQSATSLKTLAPGAEVVILITTPHWFGVETVDGEHGWIHQQQLERLP